MPSQLYPPPYTPQLFMPPVQPRRVAPPAASSGGGGGPVSTLFSDDFNRADSTTLGNNWVEVTADWAIVSNTLRVSSTAFGDYVINTTSLGTADYEVQAVLITVGTVPVIRVIGRYVDTNNYYAVRWADTNSGLFKRVGGVETDLGAWPADSITSGDTVKLSMQGTTIKAYVNGVQKASVTDSAFASEGDFGFHGNGVGGTGLQIDNVVVTDFGAAPSQQPLAPTTHYAQQLAQ